MPDEGIYVITADEPAGKWSKPHLLQNGRGLIDPCPLWDDDGRAWLIHAYAHSRAGMKHILRVRPMAPDGSRLLGPGQIVFHQPEKHPTLEGPKFLKKDGWYYILAPAGGVADGWQVALRSRHIYGPYEDKIVLAQGGTPINGPHQGALVDAPNGEWWFIHFQDAGIYGRVTHLQPVRWRDHWPLVGAQNGNGIGEPVLQCAKPVGNPLLLVPQSSDEFDSPRLGLQWQWHANHKKSWYALGRRKGWLRLFPQYSSGEPLSALPHLLLQKFPARSFTAETLLDFHPKKSGEEAGLIVAGKSSAALAMEKTASGRRLVLRVNGVPKYVRENLPSTIRLRVSVEDGGLSSFSFATLNGFVTIPKLFQAENGVWIGAKVGLYSLRRKKTGPHGRVDIDYFRFNAH